MMLLLGIQGAGDTKATACTLIHDSLVRGDAIGSPGLTSLAPFSSDRNAMPSASSDMARQLRDRQHEGHTSTPCWRLHTWPTHRKEQSENSACPGMEAPTARRRNRRILDDDDGGTAVGVDWVVQGIRWVSCRRRVGLELEPSPLRSTSCPPLYGARNAFAVFIGWNMGSWSIKTSGYLSPL